MKKLLITLVILAFATSAMAAATTNSADPGSALKIPDTSGSDNTPLEISASPSVQLSYLSPDTTNFQYYIIGTFHAGGTKLYASSSSVTKLYNYEFASDETKDFSNLPTTQSDAQSETNWLTTLGFED